MTQAVSVAAPRFPGMRVVVPICAAHFLSHYYMIILAPLFAFIRADYGVSYTDLALALTAFNLVSAVLQTPAGFLVDRIGARTVLLAGVALGAAAFAVAGLVHSFTVFVAMFAVAGLGNTAYHPADYSLLSHHGSAARVGQIFSFHTFAGILGGAVAPVTLLAMHRFFGWRGAFIGAAILGMVVLAFLIIHWPALADHTVARKRRAAAQAGGGPAGQHDRGWRLLLSPPMLLSLCFFVLISLMGGLEQLSGRGAGGALRHARCAGERRADRSAVDERARRLCRRRARRPHHAAMPPSPRSAWLWPASRPRSSA